jgi:RNA polymerase sigma-70 factor (ECF subfamily)
MLRHRDPDGVRMPVSAQGTAAAPDAEAIWHALHDGLLGFIERRVRSREIAEDILQEVMLRIHRRADAIQRADAVGAWVHAIARNAIADHYRSAQARREVATGREIDPELADEPQGEAPDARAELAACVAPLLARLPPSYREALTMTELEGLTQAQAADRTGISLSGMKSRVQRARRQLRDVLTDCCEIELDRRRSLASYRPRGGTCDCGADRGYRSTPPPS